MAEHWVTGGLMIVMLLVLTLPFFSIAWRSSLSYSFSRRAFCL